MTGADADATGRRCPRCGYDLTGLAERCPECGWMIRDSKWWSDNGPASGRMAHHAGWIGLVAMPVFGALCVPLGYALLLDAFFTGQVALGMTVLVSGVVLWFGAAPLLVAWELARDCVVHDAEVFGRVELGAGGGVLGVGAGVVHRGRDRVVISGGQPVVGWRWNRCDPG